MTVYAANSIAAVNLSVEGHGGCGVIHSRPVVQGAPVKIWALDCPSCEDHLRHDPLWSTTISELPETHDEKIHREDFEKRGALDERKLMAMALARLTGIEVPDTIAGAITGRLPHIQGEMVCPNGHFNPAGKQFCGDCGSPMSGTAPKAAIASPAPVQAPAADVKVPRMRDGRVEVLKAFAQAHGVDPAGNQKDLVLRLGNAGLTAKWADFARDYYQSAAAA